MKNTFYDKRKNRTILSEETAKKLLANGKKVMRVEEFPTEDRFEIESEEI